MSTQNLIGIRTDFSTNHPQEFVDAVYREVFDAHPIDAEVDLVVAVKHYDKENDSLHEVVDAKLFRVTSGVEGEPLRFIADLPEGEGMMRLAKGMNEWGQEARARLETDPENGAVAYIWLHKHPEGSLFESPKDTAMHDGLTTLDFIQTDFPEGFGNKAQDESVRRSYQGGVILNRNGSLPLHPGGPVPLGEPDLDAVTAEKMNQIIINKHGLAADHPFAVAGRKVVELTRIQIERPLTEAEHKELVDAASLQMTETHKLAAAKLPPAIQALMDMFASLEKAEQEIEDEPTTAKPSQVAPPASDPAPTGPVPLPQYILDLFADPSFAASDNIENPDKE